MIRCVSWIPVLVVCLACLAGASGYLWRLGDLVRTFADPPLSPRGKPQGAKHILRSFASDAFLGKAEAARLMGATFLRLGVSGSDQVLLGRDGWLFYVQPDGGRDFIRRTVQISDHELQALVTRLVAMRDELARRGIPLLIAIPPEKHSIHPEQLPGWLKIADAPSRLTRFLSAAKAAGLPVLDLSPAVVSARDAGHKVFQLLDTHWTDRGAWAAYEVLAAAVHQWVPRFQPLLPEDLRWGLEQGSGDLANMLGLQGLLTEESPRITHLRGSALPDVRESRRQDLVEDLGGDPDGPRLLVFRDSFAHRLRPLLTPSCSRAVYSWRTTVDLALVDQERPDLVVLEWVERWLLLPSLL